MQKLMKWRKPENKKAQNAEKVEKTQKAKKLEWSLSYKKGKKK